VYGDKSIDGFELKIRRMLENHADFQLRVCADRQQYQRRNEDREQKFDGSVPTTCLSAPQALCMRVVLYHAKILFRPEKPVPLRRV
jgi:hypothetical protein